ncbi:MAG: sterol desaturase family protein [Alphaproteobacteria bacterium]|nr:sterol desaturase family protein [Alphaproteobacteria bacterium]
MNLDVFLETALSSSAFGAIAFYLSLMTVIIVAEVLVPLHARGRWNYAHLIPNFVLTATYIATNLFFTAAIVLMLIWVGEIGFGLFNTLQLDPLVEIALAVLILDFQTYAVHVAMHESSGMWRFHRVHHSDPAVDVTTALRQHPGESVIRFASLIVFAVAIGASPVAFAIYRLLSGLQAQFEHANIRVPRRLDSWLSLLVTTPNYHKVHHSRDHAETDSNYGNIFSIWDRLFFTSTPSHHGLDVDYGLEGFDDRRTQSTWGLLALPFRPEPVERDAAETRSAT